jgi:hypothetical protein
MEVPTFRCTSDDRDVSYELLCHHLPHFLPSAVSLIGEIYPEYPFGIPLR